MAPVQLQITSKQMTKKSKSSDVLLEKVQNVVAQTGKNVEDFKDKAIVLVRDPEFQTCTITTATGAVTFGSVGGAFGLASGVVVGSVAGFVPALLTFGLSVPAGAIVGGSGGLFTGILVGGSAGTISGYNVYKYRVEIKDGVVSAKLKALNGFNAIKDHVVSVGQVAHGKACGTVGSTKSHALKIVDLATSTRAGVTSTAAAGGAVVGGITGGAAGVVLGAAVGIVPAIFTFGLSIPVAATAGFCLGCATGGSAGAMGGGAVGYGGFTYRKEIARGSQAVWANARARAC